MFDDLHDYRCSSCNSADVVRVQIKAVYDELIECRSCKGIYPLEQVGATAQPSAGSFEGPKTERSRSDGL